MEVVIPICIIILIYYLVKAAKRNKLIKQHSANFDTLFPNIQKCLIEHNILVNQKSGYLNNSRHQVWVKNAKLVYEKSQNIETELFKHRHKDVQMFEEFKKFYLEHKTVRSDYNNNFIKEELKSWSNHFDNILGYKLDEQQRKAIVIDEDNNIIVAGAGTGKTTTIAGKVSYLVNRFEIDPKEILLIAFTRKASEEMRERIRIKMGIGVNVMTFHKLGKEIIAEVEGKQPSIFNENEFIPLIKQFISELLEEPKYLTLITTYFTDYLKPYKDENEFENRGEYIQFIKDNNIKCFKQKEVKWNGHLTFLRQECKSLEEVIIANYLFLNGINYEYEKAYEYQTADRIYSQYKPDFYLPDYDIYIEHFAIDRNGNVPKWFKGDEFNTSTEKYQSGIKWKREIHDKYGTLLIETYSYEKKEGVLLKNLELKLQDQDVSFSPKTPEEIWEIVNNVAMDDVSGFTQLVATFITLLKSNDYDIEDVAFDLTESDRPYYTIFGRTTNNDVKQVDLNEKQRSLLFIEIITPIIEKYNSHLSYIECIDFSDMINHATCYIENGSLNLKYQYIIIDEYQDISIGRFNFIKAIRNQNPGSKTFVVGDDWQSIFRFTGSDISLFTEFEKHFGFTERSFIETTYRFNNALIEISSQFILKNKNQISKKLISNNDNDIVPLEIFYTNSIHNDDTTDILVALKSITNQLLLPFSIFGEDSCKSILLLGRYNHDLEPLKKDKTNFAVKWDNSSESYKVKYLISPPIEMEFLTIHRAKGLEADFVFLLNCNSGRFGFPSEQSDDPLLNLVLTKADQFPNGEERRLFYVAITRCRSKVFIFTKEKYKSKFVLEIENQSAKNDHCPSCETGILTEKSGISEKGKSWRYLYCSNWNMGCEYTNWLT